MRLFTAPHGLAGFALTAPLFSRHPDMAAHATPPLGMPRSPLPPFIAGPAEGDAALGTGHPANDPHYFSAAMDDKVRILRRDVGDRARLVLSGRMADVCAALERMSRAESISCAH